jgi:hypothetical protein
MTCGAKQGWQPDSDEQAKALNQKLRRPIGGQQRIFVRRFTENILSLFRQPEDERATVCLL